MNATDNTSYATVGLTDRDVEAALDAIAAAGFPQTELLGQEPHVEGPPTGSELSEFRARLEGRGLRASSVHTPATVNVLGAPDEDWRREKVAVLGSYIRFTADIGATDMVIHPIPNPIFVPDAGDPAVPERIRAAVLKSLDDLVPVAEATGVRMNLENLAYQDCDYPYRTMEALRPLVDDYPEQQVGLIVDVGHVGLFDMDPSDEIRSAGSRLHGTHLHDVDFDVRNGDHRPPTHGGLDWDSMRAALSEVGYTGPMTFEVVVPKHSESPDEMARITRDFAESWAR